jgi:HEAT repeat protein
VRQISSFERLERRDSLQSVFFSAGKTLVCSLLLLLPLGCAASSQRSGAVDKSNDAEKMELLMKSQIKLPHRLMHCSEVLEEIYFQTGQRHAFPPETLNRQIDVSKFDGQATVKDLLPLLAAEAYVSGGTLLLSRGKPTGQLALLLKPGVKLSAAERRLICYLLGRSAGSNVVSALVPYLSDKDNSVAHHALRALHYLHAGSRYQEELYSAGRTSLVLAGGKVPQKALLAFMKNANHPTENEWVWAGELLRAIDCRNSTFSALLKKAENVSYPRVAAIVHPPRKKISKKPTGAKSLLPRLKSGNAESRAVAARDISLNNRIGVSELLAAYRQEKVSTVRNEMLMALGRKGGVEAWDIILKAAESQGDLDKTFAARALERCPDSGAVSVLMKLLAGPGVDSNCRFHAGVALGMIGSSEVVKALSDYVAKTDEPISSTALALGYIATPETETALLKCLATKKNSLKCLAYSGLTRLGSKKAVAAIALYHDEYDNTARFCGHSAIRRLRTQEALDILIKSVRTSSGSKNMVGLAAHGLEECDDPRAVDALAEWALRGKGRNQRRMIFAVQALGRIGDPRCVPILIEMMNNHKTEAARYWALRALRWRWYWHRQDVTQAVLAHPVFKHFKEKQVAPADQAENTWVCRLWPMDYDDPRAANTSYEAGFVFDEAAGMALKWGSHGQRCDVPQLNETWMYDANANDWRQKNPPVAPVGMCGTHGVSYDVALKKIMLMKDYGGSHGWEFDRGKSLRQSAPWVYDSATDRWVPVRPAKGPGSHGFTSLAYVHPDQVHVMYGGNRRGKPGSNNTWVYDLYSNSWHKQPLKEPVPGQRAHETTLFMANINKVFLKGGRYGAAKGDQATWLYDLKSNTWKAARQDDQKVMGEIMKPVVYDPISGSVLAFRTHAGKPASILKYDPGQNKWSTLTTAPEPTPHHDNVDMCYDPKNNVFIMEGGHTGWETDHIGVREVWTYKHKNSQAGKKNLRKPADLKMKIVNGLAQLSWKKVAGARSYNVYRGDALLPWKVNYKKVNKDVLNTASFEDALKLPVDGKKIAYYYVTAVNAAGQEGAASFKVRSQPALPQGLVVSILQEGSVEVLWNESSDLNVVGYNVYASSVKPPKSLSTNCIEDFTAWKLLNPQPVAGKGFLDKRKLAKTDGVFSHEVRAYQVRAVNALGIESGPSAMGFSLTPSVPAVRIENLSDGSVRVTWDRVADKSVQGYLVYRLDEVRNNAWVRVNAHPVDSESLVDYVEAPRCERRRYYVTAVDALGQEGLPSSGAWSFGRP